MATGGRHFKPTGAGSPAASDPQRAQRPMAPRPIDTAGAGRHHAPTPRVERASRGVAPIPYAHGASAPNASMRVDAPRATGDQPAGHMPSDHRGGNRNRGRRGKRNVPSYVLITIGVVLLLVAGGLFIHAQIGYKQAAEFYDTLNTQAIKDTESDGSGVPSIDFDALTKVNEDVVGWIYIPGTNINYAVVQGETNDTYLRTLISGEYNASGSVFMDMDDTAPGLVDQQTTLYGHHMNDGSMFTQVYDSLSQEKFDSIEKVYYITPDATYELEPLFTMRVEDDYVAARQANFEGTAGLAQYLSDSLKNAEAKASDAEAKIQDASAVLTLVTCDDAFLAKTKRAAMVCTLVGEVDTENADAASE